MGHFVTMRADRLISIMLLLHAKGRMTALDLAEQLEVSERTIYRDLDALSTAGIPVYTQSGPNGGVYLDEHYRISLTDLSRDDVQALFVAADSGPLKDIGLAKADSLLKLFATLPSAQRTEVERLHQRFYIDPANWFQIVEPLPHLPLLQQAVWEDCVIRITYQPVEGERGDRLIEAYALVAKANIWYLVGKSRRSGEMRNFRVARLQNISLTAERFERDTNFDLAAYWKASCETFERSSIERFPPYWAVLRVHPDAFWYFPGYMEGRYEEICPPDSQGYRTLRTRFDALGDACARIMGLGTGVEVIEPAELRCKITETARQILDFYNS